MFTAIICDIFPVPHKANADIVPSNKLRYLGTNF